MSRKIFVNLPVNDLERSIRFFKGLGFSFDPKFTNEAAGCLVISNDIYAMLLTADFFKTFTPRPICDAHAQSEVLVCVTCESREEVDEMVRRAVGAGAKTFKEPQDHGFMYGHSFSDLDGHIWEWVWMDPNAGATPAV